MMATIRTTASGKTRLRPMQYLAVFIAGLVTLVIGLASAGPAAAATAGCLVSEAQYKYSKVIPAKAETTHEEYRYKHTGKVYTIEHKATGLTNNATTNASVVSWYESIGAVYDAGLDKWQLPDAIVQAAGVNPYNVAQTGNVDLSFYGYPGHATVPYVITSTDVYTTPPAGDLYVEINNITLYYTGPNSASTDVADAIYVDAAHAPGSPWVTFGDAKTVGNNDAVPAKTVFYLPGGGQSDTNTDANWTTETPGAPWTKIADEVKDAVYEPCPVASAAVIVTAATCLQGETASVDGTPVNATFTSRTGVTVGPGDVTFTFDRTGKALFDIGSGVSPDRLTKAITKTLAGPLTDPSCFVTPKTPTVTCAGSVKDGSSWTFTRTDLGNGKIRIDGVWTPPAGKVVTPPAAGDKYTVVNNQALWSAEYWKNCPAELAQTDTDDAYFQLVVLPRLQLAGAGAAILLGLFLSPWTRQRWMFPAMRWVGRLVRRPFLKTMKPAAAV